MSLPGFELLFNSVAQQISSNDAATIVAVHWNLVSNGLKCCGTGESWDQQNESCSEALPSGWGSNPTMYTLRYMDPTSSRRYLMKALAVDGSLIVHLVREFDEKTESYSIRSRDFVNEDRTSAAKAYTNLQELNKILTNNLFAKVVTGQQQQQQQPQQSTSQPRPLWQDPDVGRSPLMEPRRGGPGMGYMPPRLPIPPGFVDPMNVGRTDLDPLAGGLGGGMFMDPRGFSPPNPFGGLNPAGIPHPNAPPGFPPGSIPPGARFDPVGPGTQRPGPDPDHERPPPEYDDMFM